MSKRAHVRGVGRVHVRYVMERSGSVLSIAISLLVLTALFACTDYTAPDLVRCATDADCPEGMGCDEDVCRTRCVTSEECTGEMVCISGFCRQPCEDDDDCPEGEHCDNGYCEADEVTDGGDGDGDGGGDECVDEDQDGYGRNCQRGLDCDDGDRSINPGAPEACHDGVDNDCDGQTDEADCGCAAGDRRACYTGPYETEGVGLCRPGIMVCGDDKEYGPCQGERVPAEEECNDEDDDCDGEADEGLLNRCGECSPPDDQLMEICGNGLDDDCDGELDENCLCDPDCHCDDPEAGTNCTCHPPTGQPCYSGPPGTLGFGICRGGVTLDDKDTKLDQFAQVQGDRLDFRISVTGPKKGLIIQGVDPIRPTKSFLSTGVREKDQSRKLPPRCFWTNCQAVWCF